MGWDVGLDSAAYGTRSIRRTNTSLICKKTENIWGVQLLLGQSKRESTVRYLGIDVDDAREPAEQIDNLIDAEPKCVLRGRPH